MTDAEAFILGFSGEQKEVMIYLHKWLTLDLGLTAKLRFNIPFYYKKSWICYLNPTREGNIELAFTRGNELSNAQGLLDTKGRKQVYSIELTGLANIPFTALNEIIQEAILLDETIKYESKRKSRRL